MAIRGLLGFGHAEVFWHTIENLETQNKAECFWYFPECVKTFSSV